MQKNIVHSHSITSVHRHGMKLNMICKWLSVLQVHDNAFRMRETNQNFLDLRKRTEILSSAIVVSRVTTETLPPSRNNIRQA